MKPECDVELLSDTIQLRYGLVRLSAIYKRVYGYDLNSEVQVGYAEFNKNCFWDKYPDKIKALTSGVDRCSYNVSPEEKEEILNMLFSIDDLVKMNSVEIKIIASGFTSGYKDFMLSYRTFNDDIIAEHQKIRKMAKGYKDFCIEQGNPADAIGAYKTIKNHLRDEKRNLYAKKMMEVPFGRF